MRIETRSSVIDQAAPTKVAQKPVSLPETHHHSYEKWIPLFVCCITALLYAGCYRFQFVYDDREQILGNPLLNSWQNIPLLFKTDVWAFRSPYLHSNYWRPLFTVWLLINKQFFGTNAAAWHLAAVALHTAVTFLVYRLCLRIGCGVLTAGTASLLFGIHPVHLETVAWLSGATDSLMTLCLVASLLLLLTAIKNAGFRKYAAWGGSLAMYALALLSKEPAMLFPLAAVAAGWWNDSPKSKGIRFLTAIVTAIPFLAVTGVYLLLRIKILQGFSHPQAAVPFLQIVINAPLLLWSYCKLLLIPVGLSVCYDVNLLAQFSWKAEAATGALVSLAVAFCLFLPRRRRLLGLLAGLWNVLFLLPVLHVPSLPKNDFLHDRYLYLPSIGFCILAALVLEQLATNSQKNSHSLAPRLVVTAAVVVFLAWGLQSQQIYWASDLLLFERAHKTAPENQIGAMNLAKTLFERGYRDSALRLFEEQQSVHSDEWYANYNLGNAYYLAGDQRAERYFEQASRLTDYQYEPYARLAELRLKQQRYLEAEIPARTAAKLQPYRPGIRQMIAASLVGQGRKQEAVQELRAEISSFPENHQAQAQLLEVESQLNDPPEIGSQVSK